MTLRLIIQFITAMTGLVAAVIGLVRVLSIEPEPPPAAPQAVPSTVQPAARDEAPQPAVVPSQVRQCCTGHGPCDMQALVPAGLACTCETPQGERFLGYTCAGA